MKILKRLTALALVCLLTITTGVGNIQAASAADSIEQAAETADEAEALVNFLVVNEPMVTTPGQQMIMMGIGDGSQPVTAAELSYRNRDTGEVLRVAASEILDDFVVFQMDFPDESKRGVYELLDVAYTVGDIDSMASFAEMGIDDAVFGVGEVVESTPDDVLLTDEELEALAAETEMSIVSLDEEGNPAAEGSIQEAMEQAGCEDETVRADGSAVVKKGAAKGVDATGMSSLVVVLDAGHGGSDPGASANGIVEKTVNLKIAQYCKAELDEYAGVMVYMTRTTDTYLSLAARAQVAIDKKADVFISLHNNSNTSSIPCGANVYYPNANYNQTCGATGKALATVIESKLTDLGLASGGIHIRNTENGTKYPDGSAADYYGVIKRCKENGIPALIVEHAFISNASDAQNYLTTDAQLKKLGVADATAVAEYYGLEKGLGFNSIQSASGTTMDLSWSAVDGVTGYSIARSVASGDGFEEVAKITSAKTTTWRDTGLKPGTTYYYKIRTYTQSGSDIKYGKYSKVASGTTMDNPMISSIKSKSSKELVISWSTINNAANYEIYRSTKKNGTYKLIASVAGINRVSYSDKTVKPGKKYYYKIRSIGQADNTTIYSDYSDPIAARTAKVPTDLSVKSQGTNTLRVSWTVDPNAAGYIIKRATSAKGKYQKVGTVEGGSTKYYDDDTVKAETTYYYMVQAYNRNNGKKGYSGYGGTASGKTIKKTAITKIVNNSSKKQTVSWKKVNGVDGYVLYQSTAKNGKYKKVKTITSVNTTSYKATGLKAGVKYFYKVKTRKKVNGVVGYGSASAAHSAWTPNKPAITSVQGSTGTSLQIFWNPVGGAQSYDIYRSEAENGSYEKIASAAGTDVSYTDTGLKMTQQYFYKIEANVKGYKASGVSGMSAPLGGYPIRSTDITALTVEGRGLKLAWNSVSNISGYQIYRSTSQNGNYELLTMLPETASSYVDVAVAPEVVYYYKIVLVNTYESQTIYGSESAVVSGKIPAVQ